MGIAIVKIVIAGRHGRVADRFEQLRNGSAALHRGERQTVKGVSGVENEVGTLTVPIHNRLQSGIADGILPGGIAAVRVVRMHDADRARVRVRKDILRRLDRREYKNEADGKHVLQRFLHPISLLSRRRNAPPRGGGPCSRESAARP